MGLLERRCNLIQPASSHKCLGISFKVPPETVAGNIVFNHFTACPLSYGLCYEMTKDPKGRTKEGKTGR